MLIPPEQMGVQTLLAVCSVNQSTGDFDACTETVDTYGRAVYSPVIKTLGSVKYIFYTIKNEANTPMIRRCSLNPANGLLNNDCISFSVPEILSGSGLTLLTTSGMDYLYYGNSQTNNVYRAQLNTDGSVSNPEQVSTSGTRLTGTQYLSPLVEYPRVKIAYAPSTNVYYPNNTYTESLYIAANVKMINKNTTVTLTAPTGITVSPATINFTASTTRVPVSISIGSNVAAGTYTITGVATNGLLVPDFTINVLNNGPKMVSYFPVNNAGITNNASVSLYTRNSSLPSPLTVTIAKMVFDKEADLAKFISKAAAKLQYSADNSSYSDVGISYSWRGDVAEKSIILVVDNSSGSNKLINGGYYRVMINKSQITDASGNALDPNATGYEELTRFRAGLKVYVTTTTFSSDLRTEGGGTDGLDGADKLCNLTANGKPNDGGYYKAMIGAGTFTSTASGLAGKNLNRYPGLNWVLFNSITYYGTVSSSGLTQVGTTDSNGKLTTTVALGNSAAFTGLNSNWNVPNAGTTNNDACNNWSYSGSAIKGYFGLTSKTNMLLYSYSSEACNSNKKAIICAQQ